MSTQSNPALQYAVMWYMGGQLPRLRAMTREQVQKVAQEASDVSLGYPLHLAGHDKQFSVPSWSESKLSGGQVIGLMVSGLWILCNENKDLCSSLYETWPIAEAVMIADNVK